MSALLFFHEESSHLEFRLDSTCSWQLIQQIFPLVGPVHAQPIWALCANWVEGGARSLEDFYRGEAPGAGHWAKDEERCLRIFTPDVDD